MSKKLIGYGYTNNKGIATLDYDADGNQLPTSGYTGTGIGNLTFLAQYHDGTTEYQSETQEVLDTIFYDTAVTGTTQTNYIIQNNRLNKEVTDNGTTISYVTGNYGHCFIKSDSPSFQSPLKIEFDIVSVNGEIYFNIMDSDGEARCRLNSTGHYELTIPINDNITATLNGNPVTVNPNNLIPNLARLSFFVVGSGATITFKELKIYSI